MRLCLDLAIGGINSFHMMYHSSAADSKQQIAHTSKSALAFLTARSGCLERCSYRYGSVTACMDQGLRAPLPRGRQPRSHPCKRRLGRTLKPTRAPETSLRHQQLFQRPSESQDRFASSRVWVEPETGTMRVYVWSPGSSQSRGKV